MLYCKLTKSQKETEREKKDGLELTVQIPEQIEVSHFLRCSYYAHRIMCFSLHTLIAFGIIGM